MEQMKGPLPSPGILKQLAAYLGRMEAVVSGELTTNVTNAPMGAAKINGRVQNVWLSVEQSGKDDASDLSFTVDVRINGTSCLTTAPIIAHVSGEVSQQKTTVKTGDTGITEAVIDTDNNDVTIGDVFTYDLVLTRTATPTTEMLTAAVNVDIEPL